jgi:hypothetical protein
MIFIYGKFPAGSIDLAADATNIIVLVLKHLIINFIQTIFLAFVELEPPKIIAGTASCFDTILTILAL